ncbi:MAG TPA: outer membrane beta-barrel protein [Opitutaceae bacterium]|nr:outer membrane beta-barrel protein [Opitutaceae bacterium]
MKNTGRTLALAALLGINASAASFLAVGDNAELFLTGAAAVRFDDNIYLDGVGEQDDIVWSFTPGVDLVFGQGSATQGNIHYREEFVKYSDASNQDTSLSNIGITTKYDSGKSKFDLAFTYAQFSQNDLDVNAVGTLVRSERTHFHALPEFGLTQKSSLGVGVTYDRTNYKPVVYTDRDTWSVPVDYYFEYSPKLDISVGYRRRETDTGAGGIDTEDNFLSLGARGEFTPKLTGQVRVGYNQRDFDTGGDDDQVGVDASLAFAASSKSTYRLLVSNDFGNAGTGDSTKEFLLGLRASSALTQTLNLDAGITFRAIEYTTRDDDYLEGHLGFTYVYNEFVNFGASYTHRKNDSSATALDFTNNVFSFGANLRY